VSLVGEDGAELLVGALRSRRSISGPKYQMVQLIEFTSPHQFFPVITNQIF